MTEDNAAPEVPAETPQQAAQTPGDVQVPAYAYPTNGLAVAALVIGIVAFVTGLIPFWGLFVGATAITLSILALRKDGGRGMSIAGLITGSLGTLMGLIMTAVVVIAIVASAGAAERAQQAIYEQNQQAQALIDSKKDFAKGEKANFGDTYEVSVNSVQKGFNPGTNHSVKEGEEFILVNMTVKNISGNSKYLTSYEFGVIDGENRIDNSYVPAPNGLESGSLDSDESVTGNVVYRVSTNANDLRLSYEMDTYSDDHRNVELIYTLAF